VDQLGDVEPEGFGVVVLLDREHRRRCLGPRLSEDCALRGVVDLEHLHAGVEVAGHGRE